MRMSYVISVPFEPSTISWSNGGVRVGLVPRIPNEIQIHDILYGELVKNGYGSLMRYHGPGSEDRDPL